MGSPNTLGLVSTSFSRPRSFFIIFVDRTSIALKIANSDYLPGLPTHLNRPLQSSGVIEDRIQQPRFTESILPRHALRRVQIRTVITIGIRHRFRIRF